MEALKRSLAVIESKMAQAKSWLKDPHGQPGKWIISAEPHRFLPVVMMLLPPQETLVRSPSVSFWTKLVRWGSCALGKSGRTYWPLQKLWGK